MPLTSSVPTVRTLLVRPIVGQFNFDPAEEVSIHHSPDMRNCSVSAGGILTKRPGYTQFPAGGAAFAGPIVGLYSTQDEENNTYFYAVTTTEVHKYDTASSSWISITGAALTGTTLNLCWFETSQNSVVFSNGVDRVQKISFALGTYADLSANCPASRSGTRFASRLYIGYTVEGASKPFRVRRAVADDHTDWVGVGSGFTDLSEAPYQVRNIRKLGAQMVVYTEQNIWLASRTNIAGAPARFDIGPADVGILAPYTLIGWKDEHFFLGTDDFYSFNGTQAEELSLPVRDTIFNTLNPGAVRLFFGVPRYDSKECLFFICTATNTVPDSAWVYNKLRKIWYPWDVVGAKCGCAHRLDDTATIDELIGTIDAQSWEFDTRDLQTQFPAMMTGHSDGKVYVWSSQYKSDNGVAISAYWTSKDFTARDIDPSLTNNKVTLKHIAMSYRDIGASFSLLFQYSVDGGASWTSGDTITFTTAGGTTKVLDALITHQVTGNKVRFKFSQSSATETFNIVSFHVALEALDAPLYS